MIQINIRKAIICLCELAGGILLWMSPELLTMGIVYLLGGGLVILGIWDGVSYFRTEALQAAKEQKIFSGLLKLGVGAACLMKAKGVVSALPALTVLYGIILLIVSAQKIQWSVDMKRMKKKYWHLAAVSGVVSLGFAAITMLNPFRTTQLLWQILGVVLGIEAVADGVILALSNISVKPAEQSSEAKEEPSDVLKPEENFAPPEELADLDSFVKLEEKTEMVEQPEGFLDFNEVHTELETQNEETMETEQNLIPEETAQSEEIALSEKTEHTEEQEKK
ncbi:MAG: DUF308 domain-containing protein [Eubacteriales bacterium]|nr:DUF308 domain-containing protein [Eubacteriales bacterium]